MYNLHKKHFYGMANNFKNWFTSVRVPLCSRLPTPTPLEPTGPVTNELSWS